MAALAGPTSWQLDPAACSVTFSHKAMWGLQTVRGTFSRVAGAGEILADGSGRGRLEIDAASLSTKNRQRDTHLRSADFFNAAEHPQVVIDITTASPEGSDSAQASGTLTAAGTTNPLAVTARITDASEQATTLAARADIDRADFGMTCEPGGSDPRHAHVSVVARFVPAWHATLPRSGALGCPISTGVSVRNRRKIGYLPAARMPTTDLSRAVAAHNGHLAPRSSHAA